MLMATALLHERLRAINAYKQSQNGGAADALQNLPTLLDIEKTHVLFTNAHFKPFAAIGFEYNKVRTTSGNPALGQIIQFSIPQFGDFFNDIACHATLLQPTLTATAAVNSDQPLMRWADFPGEALLQQVSMEVNGNPLDQYTFHSTNMHREFRVAPNKYTGWSRCVGQEIARQAYINQPTWAGNSVAPASVTSRLGLQAFNGNQTPTGQKAQDGTANLELFIPLLFWYNTDVRLAVPSVAIPYGQRFINMQLATLNQLVGMVPRGANLAQWAAPGGTITESTPTLSSIELYINNIFVNPEVHKIYIKRIGFSLIRVHRQQLYNATASTGSILLSQMKWPIEYLMVGMKITSYYAGTAAQLAQYLDVWQTFTTVTPTAFSTTGQNVLQTSQLLGVGQTLAVNTSGVITLVGAVGTTQAVPQGAMLQIASGFYFLTTAIAAATTTTTVVLNPFPAVAIAAQTSVLVCALQGLGATANVFTSNLDSVQIQAHGINIYDVFPQKFFNAYLSYTFGGPNVNTPLDTGLVFIPFCLYPGTYQPSGHINVSRAREFYINYVSSTVNSGNPGTLVVIASAINFLLISDGSAVLRYST